MSESSLDKIISMFKRPLLEHYKNTLQVQKDMQRAVDHIWIAYVKQKDKVSVGRYLPWNRYHIEHWKLKGDYIKYLAFTHDRWGVKRVINWKLPASWVNLNEAELNQAVANLIKKEGEKFKS